jgi:hypothetical protein
MKRTLIIIVFAAAALLVAAALYSATGSAAATHTVDTRGITDVQVGGASLKVIKDGQDKLVVRTTRRALPWVMARKSDKLLEIGYLDDADPRMLLAVFGASQSNDPLAFELHTTSLAKITVAGGATLEIDRFDGPRLAVEALSEKPCVLKGIFVKELQIQMCGGGDVTAEGAVNHLSIMNSGAGDFLGGKLTSDSQEINPGGSGKTIVTTTPEGPRNYPATP